MKNLFAITLLLFSFAGYAQDKEVEKGVKDEGTHQAEYNTNADVKDRNAEADSRNNQSTAGDRKDAQSKSQNDVEGVSNNGPDTRMNSSAGSTALLVDEDERDGTNTKQSATLNIAGSPVPGGRKASANDNEKNSADVQRPSTRKIDAQSANQGADGSEKEGRKKG